MYNCSIIINNNYLYYFDDITLCRRVSITTYCTVVIKYTVYSVVIKSKI